MPRVKISPPVRSDVALRERLFSRLDAAREQPLIWVSAAAGAGKTTLAATWVAGRSLPTIWYQCDERDADVASFCVEFREAVHRAFPRWRRLPPLFTAEYQATPAAFLRRYFETLFARLPKPTAVVLDNVQDVPAPSGFEEVLGQAAAALPMGVTLLGLSRTAPPPVLSRWLANRQMALLTDVDLRLEAVEAQALLRASHLDSDLDPREIGRMNLDAQGWAAGLVLMAEWWRRAARPRTTAAGERRPQRFLTETPLVAEEGLEAVFDYFAREILDAADPAARGFLLQTALLPDMTVETAAAVTGWERSGEVLARLHRDNYFTDRRGRAVARYQYHPLFRAFLLETGRREWSHEDRRALLCKGARVLVVAGEVEAALPLFREAEAWTELEVALLEMAPRALGQGRGLWLAALLDALPQERLHGNPWLVYWRAVTAIGVDPARSLKLFERALDAFEAAGDAAGCYLAWNGASDATVMHEPLFRLDALMMRLERIRERFPEFPSPEIEFQTAAGASNYYVQRGRAGEPGYLRWRGRLMARAAAAGGVRVATATLSLMTGDAFVRGEFADAEAALAVLLSGRDGGEHEPVVEIVADFARSTVTWLRGDFVACREAVMRGLERSQRQAVPGWDAMLVGMAISCDLCEGLGERAAADLARMEAALQSPGPHFRRGFYHLHAGWSGLVRGDLLAARHHGEALAQYADEQGMLFNASMVRSIRAILAAELGDRGGARTLADDALAVARRQNHRSYEYMAELTRAHLLLDDDRQKAIDALQRGLEIGRRHGFAVHPWWRRDVMGRLCRVALDEGIEVEYARHLVDRFGLRLEPPSIHAMAWPWPVRVFTFGGFSVEARAEGAAATGDSRPMDLLKALVAFGGRDVPEQRLVDALWPDAEGDTGHRAFKVNLHRLRKLLGGPERVLVARGRVSLERGSVWTDAAAFEDVVRRISAPTAAARNGDKPADWLAERLLDLYRGPFLDSEEIHGWVRAAREQQAAAFRRGVALLGEAWERAGRYDRALELYERALSVEPDHEGLFVGLMRCQLARGRPGDVLATFDRARHALEATFGTPPSDEAIALATRARNWPRQG